MVVCPIIPHLSSLSLGHCAQLFSVPARGRTSSYSSLQPTFSCLSFSSPHTFRFSSRLLSHRLALSPRGRCAHHFSRRSASRLSCWGLFARAFLTHSFPTPRSLYNEASLACSLRSFIHAHFSSRLSLSLSSLSLSLRCAKLCSASLALFLCLVSRPCLSRASPSASSLLVPRLSSFQARHPSSIAKVRNTVCCMALNKDH